MTRKHTTGLIATVYAGISVPLTETSEYRPIGAAYGSNEELVSDYDRKLIKRTTPTEEALANAKLWAASPDLLDALEELIGWMPGRESWHTDAPAQAVERARAAITKATGDA